MTRPSGAVNPWAALAVLCLGNFLILLDTSIVNTAAPALMASLDTGIDEVLWVLNGYLLALASLLIVFSRLGDLLGPRRVFVGGLGLFAIASVLCGMAYSPGQLIAARVLQGVGAAALLPQALVLISMIFAPQRRGAAFGIFTAVAGVAAVSGPTLGGLVVTELGWQWIFFVNVPLAVGGIVAARRLVPDLRTPSPRSFDAVGVLLATTGLFALVYGLIEGERHRWGTVAGPVTIPVVLSAALLLLAAFVWWERRQAEPLVPLTLFRDRNFTIATAITLITSFALYGFLLVFVIETQVTLGMSPLASGLAALPWTLTLSAVAPVAGRLTDRVGGRVLLMAGLAVYALGVAGVALLPTREWTGWSYAWVLVAVGLGMGVAIAPTTTEAMRGIEPGRAAAASGVLNTARQVGAALGAAVIGALLQNRLVDAIRTGVSERASELPPEARRPFETEFERSAANGLQLGSGQHAGVAPPEGLSAEAAEQFRWLAAEIFADAFLRAARSALGLAAVLLAVGSALTILMTRGTRHRRRDRTGAGTSVS
ncbi:EmrB/QacA subfamily drug resistance transporter [Micromonospora pisi]|uniref:EmrB/QacA subfamily drug resistance transporter n=1 Tax=Micromonospora pisi TaxID=589240 RepID=A0A495JD05_9ACTN|nr:DHA2 family efflux MFS transporter permease subunit [Micromonospora pisi]RKR86896.1 EmrB/QacA subfamily drug resistance transporter [Micromonospora pisi]